MQRRAKEIKVLATIAPRIFERLLPHLGIHNGITAVLLQNAIKTNYFLDNCIINRVINLLCLPDVNGYNWLTCTVY